MFPSKVIDVNEGKWEGMMQNLKRRHPVVTAITWMGGKMKTFKVLSICLGVVLMASIAFNVYYVLKLSEANQLTAKLQTQATDFAKKIGESDIRISTLQNQVAMMSRRASDLEQQNNSLQNQKPSQPTEYKIRHHYVPVKDYYTYLVTKYSNLNQP
jgi:short-subunit dehydrogenase involved in D-alanine esterification of teichoic acids